MGVKNKNAVYDKFKCEWDKCLAFTESEKAVHDGGEKYLTRVPDQTDDEFLARVRDTSVSMLAKRSAKAMVGMVARKPTYIKEGDSIEDLIESIDDKGNDYATYEFDVLSRFSRSGRCATVIDVPEAEDGMTVAQAEELGIRPRFIRYDDVDIWDWRTKKVGNVEQLVMLKVREDYDDMADEWTWEVVDRYRVFDIDENGKYRQRLYDCDETLIKEFYPKMNGQEMTFLPLRIHGGVCVTQPPLNDAVDANRHQYQLFSEYRWGLKMAATPTPWAAGVKTEEEAEALKYMGAGRIAISSNDDFTTGFREFTGQGLAPVKEGVDYYADLIAQLSIQFATDDLANVSATASSINQGNSTASLTGVITVLEDDFTWLLKVMADWDGRPNENIVVKMNRDFMPTGISAQDFQALLQAYIQGTISYSTYYANLVKGEVADPNKEPDDELADINDQMPAGMTNDVDLIE